MVRLQEVEREKERGDGQKNRICVCVCESKCVYPQRSVEVTEASGLAGFLHEGS